MADTPIIKKMQVIPVAGYDSMLMTLSGCHAPGLGVHLNMEKVMKANQLYNSLPSHDRDDAKAMQYLIPGWKYDHKKPALVR